MENVVECKNLTHYYGKKLVYENMSFNIRKGSIFGLLGKNGTGKTTTVNILHGYLEPQSGECVIFGERSDNLSPAVKARIGFLMEGHVQFNFMNIIQIERFYSSFYRKWQKDVYYDLMAKIDVTPKQRISTMSCGQRSQVALGLILAQDPDLMILDDYSMGLDAGYRRLFLDYLKDYAQAEAKTIFITSHIIQDLEGLINDFVILDYRSVLLQSNLEQFKSEFKMYTMDLEGSAEKSLEKDDTVTNFEMAGNHAIVYSFRSEPEITQYLSNKGIVYRDLRQVSMSLEDAFIGITGKY